MARRILFIINPAAGAGKGASRWARFEREFQKQGVQFAKRVTNSPGDAIQIARETAGDHDLLVAVGGDGTISEIAHGLLSSSAVGTALGIVPVGTGNDMAGTVGIRNYWDA